MNITNFIKKIPPWIFLLAMIVVCIFWSNIWIYTFWGNNYYTLSEETLALELLKQPTIAFREELMFRFLPFMLISILWWISIKVKIPSIVVILIGVLGILSVQIIFGLSHIFWDQDVRTIIGQPPAPAIEEIIQHIVLQGGMGIILSFTYLKFLLNSRRVFKYVHIIPLFACVLIHMLNNQVIILLGIGIC